jgi:Cys-tRNA(Pro) deacylase
MIPDASRTPEGTDETATERQLRSADVIYALPPTVEGAQNLEDFAAKSGLRPAQVLKSLLLDVDGQKYAMLVIPGDREADFAALRRFFSARSVRMADREAVEAVTGYRIGTVTPFGLRSADLPVLFDEAGLGPAIVSIGTGVAGRHVRSSPADLVRELLRRPAHSRATRIEAFSGQQRATRGNRSEPRRGGSCALTPAPSRGRAQYLHGTLPCAGPGIARALRGGRRQAPALREPRGPSFAAHGGVNRWTDCARWASPPLPSGSHRPRW